MSFYIDDNSYLLYWARMKKMLVVMQPTSQQRRKLNLLAPSTLAAVFTILLLIAISTVATAQRNTMTIPDKFITVYGQKIHYTEVGSGPVVVLLHNLGGDLSDWNKTILPLSQQYRVIAFDQIGAGQSDKPFINYRPATWVDFLNGVNNRHLQKLPKLSPD